MSQNAKDADFSSRERPIPSVLLRRPPPHPNTAEMESRFDASRGAVDDLLPLRGTQPPHNPSKENWPEAALKQLEEMRNAPALSRRVTNRKDFAGAPHRPVVRSSGELVELEGILMYVECVTASLSHRARAPPPPEDVLSVQSSVMVSRRVVNSEFRAGSPQCSVAMSLHDASNNLLSCFSRLEYVSLSASVTLQDIERNLSTASSDTGAALDAIERRYGGHEVPDVREFFVGSRLTVDECRKVATSLQQLAQKLLAIRRVVAVRDLPRTQQLFDEYKKQRPHAAEVSQRSAASPIITWLEKKWFPAMSTWNSILSAAREQAATGDVDGAIAAAQQSSLSQSSVLSEILQPGETLSELLREQLELPLAQMAESFKLKNDRIEALRTAIATVRSAELAGCLCAAEELAAAGQLSDSERALVKEGKKLVIRLHQVSNVEAALSLAADVGETVTLFRTIHQANSILLDLRIAGDVPNNKEVVRRCSALLTEMESTRKMSPSEFIARHVDATKMNIAHVPSLVWTASTTASYQHACQRFTARTAQDLARLDLERVLNTNGEDTTTPTRPIAPVSRTSHTSHTSRGSNANRTASSGGGGDEVSNQSSLPVDLRFARMPSQMSPTQMRELRATLDRARQVGFCGPILHQGEARLRVVEALRIKVHFEAQLRVLRVEDPEKITFDGIYDKLVALCSQQAGVLPRSPGARLRVRYQDSDGDNISIVSQEDWNTFIAEFALNGVCGARLELYCDFPPHPQPQPREAYALFARDVPRPNTVAAPDSPLPLSAESNENQQEQHQQQEEQRQEEQQQQQQQLFTPVTQQQQQQRAALLARPRVQLPSMPTAEVSPQYMRLTRTRSACCALVGRSGGQVSRPYTPGRRVSADDFMIQCRGARLLPEHVENQQQRQQQQQQQQQQQEQPQPQPSKKSTEDEGNDKEEAAAAESNHDVPNRSAPVKLAPKPRRQSPVVGRLRPNERPAISSNVDRTKRLDGDAAKTRTTSPAVTTPARLHPVGEHGAAAAVAPPAPQVVAEAPNVKRWCDDEDHNFELRTVLSTNTTVVSSATRAKKSTVVSRRPNKFTVTPIPRVGTGGSKPVDRQEKPLPTANTGLGGAKREWKEDMFTMSDICTVASECTTPQSSFTNRARVKPSGQSPTGNLSPPRNQQQQQQRPAPVSAVSASPDVNATSDLKKKSEALRQLRQLREENQKALKAAINQRKTSKS